MSDRKRRHAAACGQIASDLVLRQAEVVNMFTEEVVTADVAVMDGIIVGVGRYEGERELDCRGLYLVPGLIDAHMHLESSQLQPSALAQLLLRHGTTAVIADPHELVNVAGAAALRWLLSATEHLPLDFYLMLPACVPATDFDTNGGGSFTALQMQEFIEHPRVLGLGEVMNYPAVIAGAADIYDKLALYDGLVIDGHAPGVCDHQLQSYRLAGISTEHECVAWPEALEKLRAGMQVLIREGSGAKNLSTLIKGLLDNDGPYERCSFCTDDRHLADLVKEGHLDYCVRRAIDLGVPALKALKMASFNTARCYGLQDRGATAAGYQADLLLLSDLEHFTIEKVLKNGCFMEQLPKKPVTADTILRQTVKIPRLTSDSLQVTRKQRNHLLEIVPGQILTRHRYESIPGVGNVFSPDHIYSKLCVIERYGKNGHVAAAPVKGVGIVGGAIASTVAHDSHNLVVVGDNDDDIMLAVNRTAELEGGYVVVSHGQILAELPLPLGGLLSDGHEELVLTQSAAVLEAAHRLQVAPGFDPLTTLSFLSLPVIPELRLLDSGLFDVVSWKMLEN